MKKFNVLLSSVSFAFLVANATNTTVNAAASVKQATNVQQVLAWFSQPEDGGNYAALQQGYYKAVGLNVTIDPGSPEVSSIQMVASGKAQFGYTTGDTLLLARSHGIPVVAIFGTFQRSPMVLISHKSDPLTNFSTLSGRTVFTTPGIPYWAYIKQHYKLTNLTEEAYEGNLTPFLANSKSVTQGYLTNEVYALHKKGISIDYKLISDSGYEPYDTVLFTTENYVKDHPSIVKSYVDTIVKGWTYYEKNYQKVNSLILKSNPNGTLNGFNYATKQERNMVYGGDAATHRIGYMSKSRWQTLENQMLQAGLIQNKVDLNSFFTDQFISKPMK